MKKNINYSELIKNLDNTAIMCPVIEFNDSIDRKKAQELANTIMDISIENFRNVSNLANIVLDKNLDLPPTISCDDYEHFEDVFNLNTLDEIVEKKLLSDKEIIIVLYSKIVSSLYSACRGAEELCEILDYKLDTNIEPVISELHYVLTNIFNNISVNRIQGNEPIRFTGINREYFERKITSAFADIN